MAGVVVQHAYINTVKEVEVRKRAPGECIALLDAILYIVPRIGAHLERVPVLVIAIAGELVALAADSPSAGRAAWRRIA